MFLNGLVAIVPESLWRASGCVSTGHSSVTAAGGADEDQDHQQILSVDAPEAGNESSLTSPSFLLSGVHRKATNITHP